LRPNLLLLIREIYRKTILPDWVVERLRTFADLEVVVDPARLPRAEYVALYAGRDGVLTTWNTPLIDRQVVEKADRLRIISHCGGEVRPFLSGEVFEARPDLVICNASSVMAQPVAEHTLTVTLALLRSLIHFKEWVKEDEHWWEYDITRNRSLIGKKVGVVGLGQIAWEFVKLVRPFEVELHVYSNHLSGQEASAQGLRKSTLEEIFSACDVIVLCAANTPANRGMVTRELLRTIKPGAILVNNARGALLDEQALIDELKTGRFQAAIDVTEPEPPVHENPLRDMPNVLLTPHIGGPVPEQRIWMMREAVENIENFFNGKPVRGLIDRKRFSYMA
jgi:phosphoglycerate dehydrogenase-like enzyme